MPFLGLHPRRGETVRARVHVADLPDSSELAIPVQISRGVADGPTLYVQAGLHGDEETGIAVCRRFLEKLDPLQMAGTVVAVPVLNIPAFLTRSRSYEHEERRLMDANRLFPGSRSGLLTERIAAIAFEEFVEHADLTIDLHSALDGCSIAPFIYIDPDDDEASTLGVREGASRAFGTPYVYRSLRGGKLGTSDLSRSLSSQADAAGRAVLPAEMGESGRVSTAFVEMGASGIDQVMRFLEMRKGKLDHVEQRVFTQVLPVHCSRGGGLRLHVSLMDEVQDGEILCDIVDLFGNVIEQVRSPAAGFVLRVMLRASVGTGAEIVWIAS